MTKLLILKSWRRDLNPRPADYKLPVHFIDRRQKGQLLTVIGVIFCFFLHPIAPWAQADCEYGPVIEFVGEIEGKVVFDPPETKCDGDELRLGKYEFEAIQSVQTPEGKRKRNLTIIPAFVEPETQCYNRYGSSVNCFNLPPAGSYYVMAKPKLTHGEPNGKNVAMIIQQLF